jgi:hypothetical protein
MFYNDLEDSPSLFPIVNFTMPKHPEDTELEKLKMIRKLHITPLANQFRHFTA